MVVIVTNTKIVILVIPPILYGLNFLMPPLLVLLLSPPFPLILPHPFKVLFTSWSSFSSLSSPPLTNPFSYKWRLGSGKGLLPPRVEEVRMDRVSGIHLNITISCWSGHLHYFLGKCTRSEVSLFCYTVCTGRAGLLLWREGMHPPSSAPPPSSTFFPHPVWYGEIRVPLLFLQLIRHQDCDSQPGCQDRLEGKTGFFDKGQAGCMQFEKHIHYFDALLRQSQTKQNVIFLNKLQKISRRH